MPKSEHTEGRPAKLNEAREYLRAAKERAIEAQGFESASALREMEFAIRDGMARMEAVERENLQLRSEHRATPVCGFCGGDGWVGGELEPRRPCTGCNSEARRAMADRLKTERDSADRRLAELRRAESA
jgi:hypothetical protein